MQISLEEFLKYFIKKWKMIGVVILVCVILFAGTATMFGEEISVPHSDEYLFYEDALARHLMYVEESLLMTLDPTSIHERTIFLRNISDKKILESYVASSEIWDELRTDRNKKYISELLTWKDNPEIGSAELVLRHETAKECEEWAEYIAGKIIQYDPDLEVIVGPERIVADEEVQLEQLRRYTRTEHIKSLLLDSQAGYTISISIPVAGAVGGLMGSVLSVVLVFVLFIFDKNSRNVANKE